MPAFVRVTEGCPPDRGTPGEYKSLPQHNAEKWEGRGWGRIVPREEAIQHLRETTAVKPSYVGRGWWEVPGHESKVRAPKDADPDEVIQKAEEG